MRSKKKKSYRLKRKALIEPEMIECEAFRSLNGTEKWILLRFLQKRTWREAKINGRKTKIYENGGLTFTYQEAHYFGISNASFYRAIKTLVERGFLDVEHRGGTFGRGEIRDYTRFQLSDRWRLWGSDKFKKKEFEVLRYKGEQVQARIKTHFQN